MHARGGSTCGCLSSPPGYAPPPHDGTAPAINARAPPRLAYAYAQQKWRGAHPFQSIAHISARAVSRALGPLENSKGVNYFAKTIHPLELLLELPNGWTLWLNRWNRGQLNL